MDGGAWWATVHGAAKSRTQLDDFTFFSFFIVLTRAVELKVSGSQNCGPKQTALASSENLLEMRIL